MLIYMPSSTNGTLTAERADMQRVHRRVVRVGAVTAWLVTVLLLALGFVTGESSLFIEAIASGAAGALMTAQILIGRENGGLAVLGAGIVIVIIYTVLADPQAALAPALALVVVSSLGMLFVERSPIGVGAAMMLILLVAPLAWNLPPTMAVKLGAVMAGGFALSTAVLLTVRNAATALDMRFRVLFERSPTPVLEEDWSESVAYVRYEYTGSPERLRHFLLAYPEVVKRAVGKARIVRANRAAVDMLEAPDVDSLLGYRDPGKVDDGNLEAFVEALVAVCQGHGYFEHEFRTETFRGRNVVLQARCVDDSMGEDPSTVLVALADVTHIRAREESLAELIRAKDAFIASISHELRTPLTAVVGLTSELATAEMGPDESGEVMRLVNRQAEEMSFIVEDLLVAARAEMGTIAVESEPTDLDAQLIAALEGVEVFGVEIPEGLPVVMADPKRVRQILRNLLTNLDRYGGSRRRVLGGEIGDGGWLEVRDDGPGVSSDDVDRIFRPYATAHSGVAGSVGLGLSVARQLAMAMNGSLRYYRDGDETVFRLELPLAAPAQLVGTSSPPG